jgi:predicted component of type VI protein secretion system
MAKLDDVLASINRRLYEEYKGYGIPAEERLFEQLDIDTTQDAIKDAVTARRVLGQVDARNNSRYGVTTNSAQRTNQARRDSLASTAAQVDAGNSAIIADQDRELQTLQTLMNQGASLRNAAQGGLGVAAANEQSRDTAYSAAQQQYKSNVASTVGLGAGLLAATFI